MRTNTKLLIIVFALLLLAIASCNNKSKNALTPSGPQAVEFTVDSLNYRVNDDGSTVTVTSHVGGQYAFDELHIPDAVSYNGKNYTVTAIGHKAFFRCESLHGPLNLPNTITKIGDSSFYSCNFTGNLNLPGGLNYIGDNAFYYCLGFTGPLYIPDSVTYLGARAFFGCMWFDGTLHIPRHITEIKTGTFNWCQKLIGTLYIPKSVTEIGDYAFQGCPLFTSYLEIPESVTYIGMEAFSGCTGFSEVYCLATEPPTLRSDAFPSNVYSTLTVPCNTTYQYQHSPWYLFFDTIVEDCDKN